MKKLIVFIVLACTIAAATLFSLSRCSKTTDEQKTKSIITKAVVDYANANFIEPKHLEITEIKIDTIVSNHAASEMRDMLFDSSFFATNIIYQLYVSDVAKRNIESYDTIALLDTTKPDVFYSFVTVTVRHYCTNTSSEKCMCKIYLTMRNNEIIEIRHEDDANAKEMYDHLVPQEIRTIFEVLQTVKDEYDELMEVWN